MKILTVVGARPQFVKAAVLSRKISNTSGINEVLVHTGQHFDANMSDVFFQEMQIPTPQYNLNINGGTHGAMTGEMLSNVEEVLLKEKPDVLLVYGDTNSTLAGALSASKIHIPVAHVEAGLRSFNMDMPEEINRILTDRVSNYLFCPTQTAVDNLKNEAFPFKNQKVDLVGDIMYEAALFYDKLSEDKATVMEEQSLHADNYALVTVHRQENTDNLDNLKSIIGALNEINGGLRVVLPIHPRTRKIIEKNQIEVKFTMIDPIGYFDMIQLIKNSKLIFTDSGGLQKEAFFFNKFCVTMREQTEWVELVSGGYNILAGSDKHKIMDAFSTFSSKQNNFTHSYYGEGNTSDLILKALM